MANLIVTIILETSSDASELCDLKMGDIDMDDHSAMVIDGKGGKTVLYYSHTTVAGILSWIPLRESRNPEGEHLVVNRQGKPMQSRRFKE